MAGQDWFGTVTATPEGGEETRDLDDLFIDEEQDPEAVSAPAEETNNAGRSTHHPSKRWPVWWLIGGLALIVCTCAGYLYVTKGGSSSAESGLEASPMSATELTVSGAGTGGGECAASTDTTTPAGVVVAFQHAYYTANAAGVRGVLAANSPLHSTDWEAVLADVDTTSSPCVTVTNEADSLVDAQVTVGTQVFVQRYRLVGDRSDGFSIYSIEKR